MFRTTRPSYRLAETSRRPSRPAVECPRAEAPDPGEPTAAGSAHARPRVTAPPPREGSQRARRERTTPASRRDPMSDLTDRAHTVRLGVVAHEPLRSSARRPPDARTPPGRVIGGHCAGFRGG